MAMPTMPAARKTPIGVIILGVLTILSGLALAGLGGVLVMAAFFSGAAGGAVGGMFGAIFGIIGAIVLIFGIVAILAGVGLIRLRPWAWWLTMIVSILALLSSIATVWYMAILQLVIIIYLVVVKKYFGAQPAGM